MLLTDMFNRAIEDDLMAKNPAKGVKIPVERPEKEIKHSPKRTNRRSSAAVPEHFMTISSELQSAPA